MVAGDASTADAETAAASVAAAFISIALSGSDATVNVTNGVSAEIENGSTVDAAGALTVSATGSPEASGFAAGVTAGTLAVGESAAIVNATPTVTATVGGTINAGSMNVIATTVTPNSARLSALTTLANATLPGIPAQLPSAGNSARAEAVGSAGGLIGLVATDAEATNTSLVTAGILASSVVNVVGALVITSLGNSRQSADSGKRLGRPGRGGRRVCDGDSQEPA